MRKNGINKELVPIDGGVCAPTGFYANGINSGILNGEKEDLALITSDRRVPTACVFSPGGIYAPSVTVTQKHLKSNRGQAQAILLSGGVVNLLENGVTVAESACRELERKAQISRNEIVTISTGKMGLPFASSAYLQGVESLVKDLKSSEVASLKVARVIAPIKERARQTAFSFWLGDTLCKIGAVFQKGIHDEKTSSGLVCVLTTDVCITPELLQKALTSAVKDTFDLLCVDGVNSPCDTVCLMANGKAENYKISAEDTDYDKFRYFLTQVLTKISYDMAASCAERKAFLCLVEGAKSKQAAREVAKSLAYSYAIKRGLAIGAIEVDGILCSLHTVAERISLEELLVTIKSNKGEVVIFEDGKSAELTEVASRKILFGEQTELFVRIGKGNYTAVAIGVF